MTKQESRRKQLQDYEATRSCTKPKKCIKTLKIKVFKSFQKFKKNSFIKVDLLVKYSSQKKVQKDLVDF